jgi:hypothetical protein
MSFRLSVDPRISWLCNVMNVDRQLSHPPTDAHNINTSGSPEQATSWSQHLLLTFAGVIRLIVFLGGYVMCLANRCNLQGHLEFCLARIKQFCAVSRSVSRHLAVISFVPLTCTSND